MDAARIQRTASALAPLTLQKIGENSALAAGNGGIKRGVGRIVLLGFAQRVDSFPVIAFRLQRLPATAPGLRISEFDVGPGAAQFF